MYCVKCKTKTNTINSQNVITRNGKLMQKGMCTVCGKTKSQFIKSSSGADMVSSLNAVTKNIKLPWAKYPGELNLPGMNFAEPGTRLDLRLDDEGRPKDFSKQVNRVDAAAYRHDLAYTAYPNTKRRNAADRRMIDELNMISNPSLRERAEITLIKPILATKATFGLGTSKNLNRPRARRKT